MIIGLLRGLFALVIGAAVTGALGAAIQTQFNLAALAAASGQIEGADVTLALRLETTWRDILGFGPLFTLLAIASFLPAFLVAKGIVALIRLRTLIYALAGAAGIAAALTFANWAAPMPAFIAATRTLPGLMALSASGLAGGWLFARLTPPRRRSGSLSGGLDHVSFR